MPVDTSDTTAAARGERRRARTRESLLDAAESALLRHGYDAARVDDIAAEAGVSVGSIYVHFGGKRGLHAAVVERVLELFAAYARRAEDPELTPLQRVLAGGEAYLRFHLEHPGAFQFLARHDDPGWDDETEARIRDRVGRLLDGFAGTIEEAVACGEARPVDARRLTHFLWGSWNGVIALRRQPEGIRLSEREIAETLELGRWLLREALAAPGLRDENGEVGDRVPLPPPAPPAPPG
ncbi:TetR/AcrR family transcriptional regulator [Amycolatopsis sp. PS_44_ISF1]|uniref:TetR/AcrR family transcriptional regulator n=1 Tax=Amycolatopsis sp. PS_44_ISF1 TaxID=2974917 RepID=UPI0028E07376|nr:TetR/AcrR family transcriptional regulator [Amycolatopsis sp. PS_44_ISF1]MDT8912994.1 TetR/AcrR family transcriptional regulator [Amycolatopsis sp. PS_44_ISF1]